MPGRTWVIAPDAASLGARWATLRDERDAAKKEKLFHPHIRGGKPGDKYLTKTVRQGLYGHEFRQMSVALDSGDAVKPIQYGFRSFDRQRIIPDARLLNQPNPKLWQTHSGQQVYLTALSRTSPSAGAAITFTGLLPDMDHYNGRGGRVFSLWDDRTESQPNVKSGLVVALARLYGAPVTAPDVFAYIAGVAAHPAYTARFQADLVQPGLRIPVTADVDLFREAIEVGQEVIWLHCFGERFADPATGRPSRPPRLPAGQGPTIPKDGAIPTDPAHMPDSITYDPSKRRLHVGEGFVENVPKSVWQYEVSGKQVLVQWFSYRRRDRSRPIIGDRRPPSPLDRIQPDGWLAEYTKELINVLHVLGRLVALEPQQADLLDRICAGEMLSADVLREEGALDGTRQGRARGSDERQADLLE